MAELRTLILEAACEAADYQLDDDADLALYQRMRTDFVGMLGQVDSCPEGERAARCFDLLCENYRRLWEWLANPLVPKSVCDRTLEAGMHWLDEMLLCEAVAHG